MGSNSSKSGSASSGAHTNAQTLLALFRSSLEVVIGRYLGAIVPDQVPLKDEYDEDKPRSELIGEILDFDEYDEDCRVTPAYSAVLRHKQKKKERFRIALRLSDVPEVKKLLNRGVSATAALDQATGETPLVIACGLSQCGDVFENDSVTTSVPAPDGESYSRRITQQDALDCVRLLLHHGAPVTEEALGKASERGGAYGGGKTTLLRLLMRCAPLDLRESHPAYEPNTVPLRYRIDVAHVVKAPCDHETLGVWEREAEDKRTEGEIDAELVGRMCIMFCDAQSRITAWAAADNDGEFESSLLHFHCLDTSRRHIEPGFGTLGQFHAISFDAMEYKMRGGLELWSDGKRDTAFDISVSFNALDDWDQWTITGLEDSGLKGSPTTVTVTADGVSMVWEDKDTRVVITGECTGEVDGDGAVCMRFSATEPKLLTTAEWHAFAAGTRRWIGLTHIAALEVTDESVDSSTFSISATFGAHRDVMVGLPRAALLNLTEANVDERQLVYLPDGANYEDGSVPRITVVLAEPETDYGAHASIASRMDSHPGKFMFLQDLCGGPLSASVSGMGYKNVPARLVLAETVLVDADGAKLKLSHDDGSAVEVEGRKGEAEPEDVGVLVCGEYVPDSVFHAGLSDEEIRDRDEKEQATVSWLDGQLRELASAVQSRGLSKAVFTSRFEDLFGEKPQQGAGGQELPEGLDAAMVRGIHDVFDCVQGEELADGMNLEDVVASTISEQAQECNPQ